MVNLLDQVKDCVKRIGKEVLKQREFNFKTEEKFDNNLVTEIDISTEKKTRSSIIKIIRSRISNRRSNNNTRKKEFVWIIDPIDGTTNFVHNLPYYSCYLAIYCN